jgi:hypothetical protein
MSALVAVLGLPIVLGASAAAPSAQPADAPCAIETEERIVAVGDVHGAYTGFIDILQHAGLIDGRQRWIGGRAVLVQTGDLLDRGPDSRRVLDLLRRLEREASRAGGQVHALLGNHEVMRLVGDWRYVSDAEYAAFRNPSSRDLRERVYEGVAARAERDARAENRPHDEAAFRRQFLEEVPLGFVEMRLAFDADGEYGRWLRARHAVAMINGVVFLHGGISDETSVLGCEGINRAIRREIAGPAPPPERVSELLATHENGPLWYRGLAVEPEDMFAPMLDTILARMEARAIVVGHTPVRQRIATRFGGRVMLIDTGLLGGDFFPDGVASALEIHGEVVTAIYPDGRVRLSVPALERTPAPAAPQ